MLLFYWWKQELRSYWWIQFLLVDTRAVLLLVDTRAAFLLVDARAVFLLADTRPASPMVVPRPGSPLVQGAGRRPRQPVSSGPLMESRAEPPVLRPSLTSSERLLIVLRVDGGLSAAVIRRRYEPRCGTCLE